jgi:Protein of unknown function (DUF541)
MLKRVLSTAFVMCTSLAFAQLDSNSVTVTASRNVNLQPDQTVFSVQVSSGLTTSLDDIIAALQGSSIGIGNFSGVSTAPQYFAGTGMQPQPMLDWTFTLPVSLSKMKDTTATLANLQQTIPQKNSGLALSFYVQGIQVSQQLQQSQTCAYTDLLADARAQAQKLATATGLGVGAILALSSATSTTVANGVALTGFPYTSYSPVCSMTVKFALGRF